MFIWQVNNQTSILTNYNKFVLVYCYPWFYVLNLFPVAGDGESVAKMAEGASIGVLLKSLINQKFFDCIDRKEIINKNSELSHYFLFVKCNPNLENF